MSTEVVKNGEATPDAVIAHSSEAALYESLALRGDVSMLKAVDKIAYYRQLCERLGLDPMAQPFLPLKLNGKEVFYATRAATDQLARLHNVTREVISREQISDVYVVKVRAVLPSGRFEESIGAVSIGGAKGELLANQLMKCETKAKRRSTLALLGLGMLDESEIETISPRAIERLQPYSIDESSALSAISAEEGAPMSESQGGSADVGAPTIEDDERAQLQNRLLQEIQTLRDLGIAYSQSQQQLKRVTGKSERKELTNEELEKAIAAFSEWSQQLAIQIKNSN